MKLDYGNMWNVYGKADAFLITTNSTIKRNGALVMGRGIAKEARDRFPGLDLALGSRIMREYGNKGIYGLMLSERFPEAKLGAFQVKLAYDDPAELWLIRKSTAMLADFAKNNPELKIHLNFPGIGNGRLAIQAVMDIVEILPDNVTLWQRYVSNDTNNLIFNNLSEDYFGNYDPY